MDISSSKSIPPTTNQLQVMFHCLTQSNQAHAALLCYFLKAYYVRNKRYQWTKNSRGQICGHLMCRSSKNKATIDLKAFEKNQSTTIAMVNFSKNHLPPSLFCLQLSQDLFSDDFIGTLKTRRTFSSAKLTFHTVRFRTDNHNRQSFQTICFKADRWNFCLEYLPNNWLFNFYLFRNNASFDNNICL